MFLRIRRSNKACNDYKDNPKFFRLKAESGCYYCPVFFRKTLLMAKITNFF